VGSNLLLLLAGCLVLLVISSAPEFDTPSTLVLLVTHHKSEHTVDSVLLSIDQLFKLLLLALALLSHLLDYCLLLFDQPFGFVFFPQEFNFEVFVTTHVFGFQFCQSAF